MGTPYCEMPFRGRNISIYADYPVNVISVSGPTRFEVCTTRLLIHVCLTLDADCRTMGDPPGDRM